MHPVLHAEGLEKAYGKKTVLCGVDLALPPGTCTVLLGPNGAGKSTLLRLALGLAKPDSGKLSVTGFDPVRRPSRVRARVGFVPDRPDVYGWMTPRELFRFLQPQYPLWDRPYCERTAARFGVRLDTPFRDLSRGEGTKAMLTAALAARPPLLLLDEPFGGLDPRVREEVASGLRDELERGGCTALVVTHDLELAADFADRVALLADGRIAAEGRFADVLGERAPAERRALLRRLFDDVPWSIPA